MSGRRARVLTCLTVWLISNQFPAFAQDVAANYDLSSTQKTLNAQSLGQAVVIQVGQDKKEVNSTSSLTPAEAIAVQQVISTGTQSLLLGNMGNAVGGSFSMPSAVGSISNLNVPQGVTALRDFGTSSLNIIGNLTNSGNLFAYSSNPTATTASISAANISNNIGALISTTLPANLQGVNLAVANLNLGLFAVNNIINAGTIQSAGSITAVAGGSIINALPAGISGPSPIMQAMSSMNMQAQSIINQGLMSSQLANISAVTSQLHNAGVLQALSGNIAIESIAGNNLNIDNLLGSIRAADAISISAISDLVSNQKLDTVLKGGILAANDVLFNSPGGLIDVHADRIDGNIHIAGGDANIGVRAGSLQISSLTLTGDPIFANSGGDLDLVTLGLFGGGSTFSTGGGDFVAYASGNITAVGAPPGAIINAAGLPQGGKILIAAGTSSFDGFGNPIICTNCPASNSGGNVDLGPVSLVTNGNQISLQARNGQNATGFVQVFYINSSGMGGPGSFGGAGIAGQAAGPVTLLSSDTLVTGSIRAFGGGGSGGFCCDSSGGAGGAGGNVRLVSVGSILVQGDINVSGGGGGGLSASTTASTHGGNGGNSGNISVATLGTFTSLGPLLAAGGGGGAGNTQPPCCPQIFRNGGGSFGGGGGGGDVGAGGGGFFGGGGSLSFGSGGGGGFNGGGNGANGMPAGTIGRGGRAVEPGCCVVHAGGAFGVGGANTNTVAQKGFGNAGGAPGTNGTIILNSQTNLILGTVASYYGPLGTIDSFYGPNDGFTDSPFAATSVFGTLVTNSPGVSVAVGTVGTATPTLPPPPVLDIKPPALNLPDKLQPPTGIILPTDSLNNTFGDNMTLYGHVLNMIPYGTTTPTLESQVWGTLSGLPSGDAIFNMLNDMRQNGQPLNWQNPAYLPTGSWMTGDAMMSYLRDTGSTTNPFSLTPQAPVDFNSVFNAVQAQIAVAMLSAGYSPFSGFGSGGQTAFAPYSTGTGFTSASPYNTGTGFTPFSPYGTGTGFTPFSPYGTGTGYTPFGTLIGQQQIPTMIEMMEQMDQMQHLQAVVDAFNQQIAQQQGTSQNTPTMIEMMEQMQHMNEMLDAFKQMAQKQGTSQNTPTMTPTGEKRGTIDGETAILKAMIDKRIQIFDNLNSINDTFFSGSSSIIRDMGTNKSGWFTTYRGGSSPVESFTAPTNTSQTSNPQMGTGSKLNSRNNPFSFSLPQSLWTDSLPVSGNSFVTPEGPVTLTIDSGRITLAPGLTYPGINAPFPGAPSSPNNTPLPLLDLPVDDDFASTDLTPQSDIKSGGYKWFPLLMRAAALRDRKQQIQTALQRKFRPMADLDVPVTSALLDSPFPWEKMDQEKEPTAMPIASGVSPVDSLVSLDTKPENALLDATFDWQGVLSNLHAFNQNEDSLLAKTNSLSISERIYQLSNGNTYFSTDKASVVYADGWSINIAASTTGLIIKSPKSVAIYNLCDHKSGSLIVSRGQTKYHVNPGMQLLLSGQDQNFASLNPSKLIAVRNVEKLKSATGSAYACQFSVPSAIQAAAPLRSLIGSKTPSNAALMNEITKCAVIVSTIKASTEPFRVQSGPVASR